MNAPTSEPKLRGKWSRPEMLLISGSLAAVVAIISIVASILAREHSDTRAGAARAAANIVELIDADVERNAELYDTSLLGVILAWQRPDLMSISPELRKMVLFDRSIIAPYKGDMLLLDPQGNVLADSTSVTPRIGNFANRPNFDWHRQHNDLTLKVGGPFKNGSTFSDWCITFSRRMSGPNGEFLGVATSAMRVAYFRNLFSNLNVGEGSAVALINTQGILITRQPASDGNDLVGTDFSQRPNFRRMLQEENGSFASISSLDQHERLYTFSRVGDLPLIVVVGQSMAEVYTVWRRNVLWVGSATGLLCLGIMWLTLLLCRELRLRHQAEANLAQIASTDGLTGLSNRRHLDQFMEQEWALALRSGQPLSLLMIDVDHFKAFNDRHGHHGGDEALRRVAQTLSQAVRRPADQAARYGGEEFLAVLPSTDLPGSLLVAEKIRCAIEAMPHFDNDTQPITVSIGIATQTVRPHDQLAMLFSMADKALYEAKRKGRNRVEHSTLLARQEDEN
ncbi:sensor domain-containing diguanylate cyclase [Pseudomonas sp. Pseusp122]|uniref:sensor domain-containing diguanylate cyclase n=1 Tax=unclassified Pseudomonas TaxID=196821 RepID=UPI0039A6F92B